MIQQSSQTELFITKLRDCLRHETLGARAFKIAKHENVYNCGEQGDTLYFIEKGQVKLVVVSPEGKECISAVHGAGEVFGELCLTGSGERLETAMAMEATDLKVIPASRFLALLSNCSLLEGFVRYLAVRIADQQEVISQLVTAGSEHRLGTTLLELARKLGKKDKQGLILEQKLSHEELSEIVGTTRPRISEFMQRFRHLGLIETRAPHCLVVKDEELNDYLIQLASC